jgi:CHAT domain-containing protein/Tfp pilus assembly protein PilF
MVPACTRRTPSDAANILQQARLLQQHGELERALNLANSGLSHCGKQAELDWCWKFRLLKAEVLLLQTKPSEAASLLPASGPGLEDKPEIQARLLFERGWYYYELPDYSQSEQLLDDAYQLATSYRMWRLAAEIELRRGAVLARLGDAAGSDHQFRDALHLARLSNDTYLETSALGNLALLQVGAGRYDEAISSFGQVVTLSRQIQSKSFEARNLNNLGYCYIQLGQPEKAAQLFEAAQKLGSEIGVLVDVHMGLGRLGEWYAGQGNYSTALSYYQRAVEVARQSHSQYWLAKWLYQTADTLIDVGDLGRAEQYNRQALDLETAINSPGERLLPFLNAGRIAEARRQFTEAERDYRSVVAASERLARAQEPSPRLEAGGRLASLLAKTRRYPEAEAEFHRTLAFANATRAELKDADYRITYFASLIHFYQDYVDFLVSQQREADALRVVESSRARVLAERLGEPDPGAAGGNHYDYRKLARVSNKTLLSYWLAPERSFLWVITPDRIATFRLPRQSEIESLVAAYGGAIQGLRDPAREDSEAGRKLYDLLLAPTRRFIRPGSNVAIVPDGALHDLNFESLPVPGAVPHYWIEDVTASVVPSLDLAYRRMAGQDKQSRGGRAAELADSLLLFGDPQPPREANLAKLTNASSEIRDIHEQFQQAVMVTGASAQPPAYAASSPGRFSMIHFAAHAEANREDPLDSAIILSPQGDSYKLYARDVVTCPIHANLVTISACRGAGGRAYAGEGLVGFAWAFLQAGASNVVAGLWEVDDRSTAEMMKTMYSQLRNGRNPQQSLRAAKLDLVHSGTSYQKPYYWAPFQLITDSLVR